MPLGALEKGVPCPLLGDSLKRLGQCITCCVCASSADLLICCIVLAVQAYCYRSLLDTSPVTSCVLLLQIKALCKMMGSGFLSEAVMEKANEKLEAAIEDLRVKYELKAKIEAQEKEVADKAARREEAAIEAKKEGDWAMEDPELETIRKVRVTAASYCCEWPRTRPRLQSARRRQAPGRRHWMLSCNGASACTLMVVPRIGLNAVILQARMAALKQVVKETKGHREAGHGELKEIREDDFLKEVTSTK